MSAENVSTVRCIYDARTSGDLVETRLLADADIEVHPDPESAWPGIEPLHRGLDGIARYRRTIYGAFQGHHVEAEELINAGERVLVLEIERARGRFSGAPVEICHSAQIWTLRGDTAVRLDVNRDRERACAELAVRGG